MFIQPENQDELKQMYDLCSSILANRQKTGNKKPKSAVQKQEQKDPWEENPDKVLDARWSTMPSGELREETKGVLHSKIKEVGKEPILKVFEKFEVASFSKISDDKMPYFRLEIENL